MIAGLYFFWIQVALTALVSRLVPRLIPGADSATRLLAGLVLFVGIASGSLVALGAAGLLGAPSLAIALTIAVVAERLLPAPQRLPRSSGSAPLALSSRIGLAIAGGLAAWWALQIVPSGIEFLWDDLAYHAVTPAWWSTQGSLSLPPFNYQSYYPANAALLSLWFILPFGSDGCANLSSLIWISLVPASCWVVARKLHQSVDLAIAGMICFLASPQVILAARSFSAVDFAAAGMGVAALAFAAPGRARAGRADRPATTDEVLGLAGGERVEAELEARRALGLATLSGLAAGLALGVKVTMAPLVLLIGIHQLTREPSLGSRTRSLAAFAAGLLATGSYWYLQNVLITGNPLFPAAIGPFEGPFDATAQRSTTLISSMLAPAAGGRFWLDLARGPWDWPLRLGLISLAGYLVGVRALFAEKDGAARRYLMLLLAAGLLLLLLFPFQPFSGGINRPTSFPQATARFLALSFSLGLILLGSIASWPRRVELAASALVIAAALSVLLPGLALGELALIIAVAGSLSIALRFAPRRVGTIRRFAALLVLLLWGVISLFAHGKAEQSREDLQSFTKGRPMGPAWAALDALPAGSRVASLSHDPSSHTLFRPLFGSRYQLAPVPVLWNGEPATPLHTRWRDEPADWWWEFTAKGAALAADDLVENLRAAGADFVLVNKSPLGLGGSWPQARRLLGENLEPHHRVFGDAYSEIWKLGPSP